MLPPQLLQEARVLDAYAGTGALGIEGLSHGAGWVDFVERDRGLCRLIKENLDAAGFGDRSHVYCLSVMKALSFLSQPYDLVLMDPPYADNSTGGVMAAIADAGLLKQECVVVVEHAWRTAPPDRAGKLSLLRTRRYGDTALSVYRQESAP